MSPDEVIHALLRSPGGETVVCNIVDGIREGLVDRGFAREVLDWVGRLAMAEKRASENLVGALDSVRDRDLPAEMEGSRSAPDFRSRGCKVNRKGELDSEISCVVAASRLGQWIHPDDVEWLRTQGLIFPMRDGGPMVPEMIEAWRGRPASERQVRFNPGASLGRPGGVLWFTRRDCLTVAQRQGDQDPAQRSRDVLGLVHQGTGIVLAAMHMPARFLQSVRFRRPTFVDAGSHRRFKTWPDGARARQDRAWGFTTDLAKVESEKECVDGCCRAGDAIDLGRILGRRRNVRGRAARGGDKRNEQRA